MGTLFDCFFFDLHPGASYTQLGLATLASSAGEALGFLTASKMLTKYGCAAMMVFALSCYSFRFVIYGYLTEPWLAVPTELLQGNSLACNPVNSSRN
jgi:hypothetical protein